MVANWWLADQNRSILFEASSRLTVVLKASQCKQADNETHVCEVSIIFGVNCCLGLFRYLYKGGKTINPPLCAQELQVVNWLLCNDLVPLTSVCFLGLTVITLCPWI